MFCSTKPSWQGDRCAPPLHPPGRGSVRALNPCRSQQTVSPVNHSRETSLSLHPSIPSGGPEAIAPLNPLAPSGRCTTNPGSVPATPDTPMTISWRPTLRGLDAATSWRRPRRDQGGEHSCCPSLEPSHRPRGASHPLEPRPTLRQLDVVTVLPLNHNQGTARRHPEAWRASAHGSLRLPSMLQSRAWDCYHKSLPRRVRTVQQIAATSPVDTDGQKKKEV